MKQVETARRGIWGIAMASEVLGTMVTTLVRPRRLRASWASFNRFRGATETAPRVFVGLRFLRRW